jgi:hypothetical protein
MWLFTKSGHLSIGQDASNHDNLVVHAQLREDIDNFVEALDAVSRQTHEVQETTECDYRFLVVAWRVVVAEAIAKMVTAIDYGKFIHSIHFDFGKQPGFLVWMNPTGLQVATVRE